MRAAVEGVGRPERLQLRVILGGGGCAEVALTQRAVGVKLFMRHVHVVEIVCTLSSFGMCFQKPVYVLGILVTWVRDNGQATGRTPKKLPSGLGHHRPRAEIGLCGLVLLRRFVYKPGLERDG